MFFLLLPVLIFLWAPILGIVLGFLGYFNYPFEYTNFQVYWRSFIGLFVTVYFLTLLRHSPQTLIVYSSVRRAPILGLLIGVFSCVVLVFILVGIDFLVGGVSRGFIRVQLGSFGPILRLILGFILPMLLVVSASRFIRWSESLVSFHNLLVLFFLFGIGLSCSIMSGYKGPFIYIVGPLTTYFLVRKGGLRSFCIMSILVILFLLLSTSIVRNIGIENAFLFLMYRIFYMSGYGDICGMAVLDNLPSLDVRYVVNNIAGSHIYQLIFSEQVRSNLNSNLSYALSLACYPDVELVRKGVVNITVTGISELEYVFGKFLFIPLLFLLWSFGVFLRKLHTAILMGYRRELFSAFGLVFIFSIVLTWLNSGSIFSIFSLFNVIYLLLSLSVVSMLSKFCFKKAVSHEI